ncbi:MAG: class I SAM-dependent methyltransferase [Pseudodesulfovibrio sp.]
MQRFKEFILAIPFVYNLVQWIFDSEKGWQSLVSHIDAKSGDVVLDIGSGTSNILEYLPGVTYHGYDINEEYLAKAKEKYAHLDANFHCALVSKMNMPDELAGNCDLVLAKGVLHHLTDDEIKILFKNVDAALKKGGRFVSVDPVFLNKQRRIAKYFVGADRGRYVRHIDDYNRLYKDSFNGVFESHLENLSRFPLDEIIFVASKW